MDGEEDREWTDEELDEALARLPRVEVDGEKWDGMVEVAAEYPKAGRERRTIRRLALATAVACGLAWLTSSWSMHTQHDVLGPPPSATGRSLTAMNELREMLDESYLASYEGLRLEDEDEADDRSSVTPAVELRRQGHA